MAGARLFGPCRRLGKHHGLATLLFIFCSKRRTEVTSRAVREASKFVDGFPMTVTGKIQKFLMREQMIDELGLSLQETA